MSKARQNDDSGRSPTGDGSRDGCPVLGSSSPSDGGTVTAVQSVQGFDGPDLADGQHDRQAEDARLAASHLRGSRQRVSGEMKRQFLT